MPLYTPPTPGRLLNFERLASDGPVSLGSELGATAANAWESSPIDSMIRFDSLRAAGQMGAPLTKADAEQRISDAGIKGRLAVPDTGITDQALDILIRRKRDEIKRQDILSRGPQGFLPGVAKFSTALVTSLLDPINIGATFVPVVGEERYMSMLNAARGAFGRAGVRAAVGGAQGAAGMALIEPLTYAAKSQEQADYGMSDALMNIAFGTVFGGGLHAIGGVVGEAIGTARRAAEASPLKVRESVLRTAVGQLQNGENVNIEPILDAYHGSPHNFETVDSGHVTTGADGYGPGLNIAQSLDHGPTAERITALQTGITEAEARVASLEQTGDKAGIAQERASIDQMRAELAERVQTLGQTYDVHVKAAPETLLDLNKPLSEQSPQVRTALETSDKAGVSAETPATTAGRTVYDRLVKAFKDDKQALAEHLHSLGIRGLKYADETAAGKAPHYVIFNPRDAVALRHTGEDLASAARRQGSPENSITGDVQAASAADAQLTGAVEPDEEGNALRARVDADVAKLKETAAAAGVDIGAHLKELDQYAAEANSYGRAARAAVLCGVNH